MFAKLAVFVATFGVLASAWTTTTVAPSTSTSVSQCDQTSTAYCCASSSIVPANNAAITSILTPLNIVVDNAANINAILTATCTTIGIGGNCNQQAVCCGSNNVAGGLVAVGCVPVTIA